MAAKRRAQYANLLVDKGVISQDQLAEAEELASQADIKLPEAIIRLGYASGEEVMSVLAEQHGHPPGYLPYERSKRRMAPETCPAVG